MPVDIGSERLALRVPVESDAPALCAYHVRNAERFERWDPPRSRDVAEHARWIRDVAGNANARSLVVLLAFERSAAPDSLVAEVVLSGFSSEEPASAMLSYTVDAAYEGRGFAFEAVGRAVAFAFDDLSLRRLIAHYDPANARSERLLLRLGFARAARVPVVPGLERSMRAPAVAILDR